MPHFTYAQLIYAAAATEIDVGPIDAAATQLSKCVAIMWQARVNYQPAENETARLHPTLKQLLHTRWSQTTAAKNHLL